MLPDDTWAELLCVILTIIRFTLPDPRFRAYKPDKQVVLRKNMYLEEKQLILTRKRILSILLSLKVHFLRLYQFSSLLQLTLKSFPLALNSHLMELGQPRSLIYSVHKAVAPP